ncbi:MAG: peptidyl-prolyl cis-trans isomerase [Armatimonadota bacterium]
MSRSRLVAAVALAVACATVHAQQTEQPVETPPGATPEVLATVDGEGIDADHAWWHLAHTRGGQILDELIVRHLIFAEADRRGLKVGTPEVDEALARIVEQHGSQAGFERWLHENGQTEKGLRMELQRELLLDKLIGRQMGLTEDGIRRYYDSHSEQFTEAPRVHLLDIVTVTMDDAFIARERLAAGHEFAVVAREMSRDPTAEQGGDRGWIEPDDVLRERVSDVVFALEEGEISDPVDCGDHAHVFFAKEVEQGRQIPFEEAREAVIERIREVRGVSEELYVSLLKRRAEIDVEWEPVSYLNDSYADLRAIKVVVDDERLELPAEPRLLENSHLIVPAVPLLEAMGTEVTWNAESGVLEARRDGTRLRLVRGADLLAVGDSEMRLKEAPTLVSGVLMVSPRGPVEALGGSLVWNRTANTLYVDSRADETVEAETSGAQ